VTDKNLSKLCDHWELYDYRFYQDSAGPQEKTRETIQGTLTEAIFGVIFVERDIDGIQNALHLIDPAMNGSVSNLV
jgi:dsRNA-specific ribonuclease